MPDLEALLKNNSKTTISCFGEDIEVTYKPGVITQEWLDSDKPNAEALSELLVSWNLTKGKGKAKRAVPTTAASLSKLPSALLSQLIVGILRDAGDVGEAVGSLDVG